MLLTPRVAIEGDYVDDDFDDIMAQLSMASSPNMFVYVTKQLEYIDAHWAAVQLPTYPYPEAFASLRARKEELTHMKDLYVAAEANPAGGVSSLTSLYRQGAGDEELHMDIDANVDAGECPLDMMHDDPRLIGLAEALGLGQDWDQPPPTLTPGPSSEGGGMSPSRSSKRSRGRSTDSEEEAPSPPAPAAKSKAKAKGKGKAASKEPSETSARKTGKKRRNVSGYSTPASDGQFLTPGAPSTMRPRSRQAVRPFESDTSKSFDDLGDGWGGGGSSSGGSHRGSRM